MHGIRTLFGEKAKLNRSRFKIQVKSVWEKVCGLCLYSGCVSYHTNFALRLEVFSVALSQGGFSLSYPGYGASSLWHHSAPKDDEKEVQRYLGFCQH